MFRSMARILVVEDDALLRKSVTRILAKAGHEVWETAGPQAAMSILSQTPIDVVVTDIHMPGMSGVELILQIDQGQRPRVIAMSGGGVSRRAEDALAAASDAGAGRTLEKPFEARELIAAIEAVLRDPGAAG
jgi:DNA-binding response OmpR family regulator